MAGGKNLSNSNIQVKEISNATTSVHWKQTSLTASRPDIAEEDKDSFYYLISDLFSVLMCG